MNFSVVDFFNDLGQRSLGSLLSAFSKDFSSETIWKISIKFRMHTPGKG